MSLTNLLLILILAVLFIMVFFKVAGGDWK